MENTIFANLSSEQISWYLVLTAVVLIALIIVTAWLTKKALTWVDKKLKEHWNNEEDE